MIDAIVSAEGVVRSATLISLATQVPYRILPLVQAVCRAAPVPPPGRPEPETDMTGMPETSLSSRFRRVNNRANCA